MLLFARIPSQTHEIRTQLPKLSIFLVVLVCAIPTLLNLLGVDFGTPQDLLHLEAIDGIAPDRLTDVLHQTLAGSFTHTLLEWSAFCTAIFTVILALAHFAIVRDVTTPTIGVALFFAGVMDAFHTLAADRLIEVVADNRNLIPFTWAICRLSNAVLAAVGVSVFLVAKPKKWQRSIGFVFAISLGCGMLAYAVVRWCATSAVLPETQFPDAFVTRPWDVVPLLLFLLSGLVLYPAFYKLYPSLFSHALIISTIPNAVTQLHMAFGSQMLFDNHFNIAHFLKIVAYGVPLFGLILDYIYTHRTVERTNAELSRKIGERQQAMDALDRTQKLLQEKNQDLQNALDRLQTTQAQLIQTEKMSSLGQLVGGVAHEINNPVNFIYGNVIHTKEYVEDILQLLSLYQQEFPDGTANLRIAIEEIELEYLFEDLPKALDSIQHGAERIRQIVESLRNFSRLDESASKTADLHEGIESTLVLLDRRLKNRIRLLKKYGALPKIECYPSELNQVWMSLLGNAIDAVLEADVEEPTIVVATGRPDKETVWVAIADNGCGMSAEVREKVFDPFFTTKPVGKGTGLGLSICYRIVEKHRGAIELQSRPGEGTRVTVTLPVGRSSAKKR
ncbi:Serine/threonine protein kinase PrkC regulator of stationary phase [Geitlerinema sp. FC II]|nr:Serine/threonine protein kinase PrkC regulator of stationary phase [Geitlerinema sp. FC II]